MKRPRHIANPSHRRLTWLLVVPLMLVAWQSPLGAQGAPPIQGTMALEGTMKIFYRAANTIIVTTVDGMEHVYHFAKDLVVPGGKVSGVDALEGLHQGTTVVVHYTATETEQVAHEIDVVGDEGLTITEGTVRRIDRGRQRITVRFASGRTETFQLTGRAAAEAASGGYEAAGATKVVIYYKDEHGRKVVYFFRTMS